MIRYTLIVGFCALALAPRNFVAAQSSYPLHHAAMDGNSQEVTRLIQRIPPTTLDDEGNTPLHKAANAGHAEITRQLLGAGADIDAQNLKRQTPLHCATSPMLNDEMPSWYKTDDVVEILLGARARTDLKDSQNRTAVGNAARTNRMGSVKLLFSHGASLPDPQELGVFSEKRKTLLKKYYSLAQHRAWTLEQMLHGIHPDLSDDLASLIRQFESDTEPLQTPLTVRQKLARVFRRS